MKTYSWKEISKHNGSNGSYWLVIHGSVHDLTNFLEEHPGGEEILMNLAGKDATECFDDIGHSYDAKTLCKKFKIGVVCNPLSANSPVKTVLSVSRGTNRRLIALRTPMTLDVDGFRWIQKFVLLEKFSA